MAASLLPDDYGHLIDPFNGQADLALRILRTPLEPAATFSDDPLRMMRAFRFAAQLDFSIAAPALAAIRDMRDRIAIISMERIRDEFLKLLAASKPSVGLAPMQECGLLQYVFPELSQLAGVDQRSMEYPDGVKNFHHKDVFYHTTSGYASVRFCTTSPNHGPRPSWKVRAGPFTDIPRSVRVWSFPFFVA
jgi:tRNA nucleotidyltransferase/poly(A) polymerase